MIIPYRETYSVLFRTLLILQEPVWETLHCVSAFTAIVPPLKIGRILFVTDKPVYPVVGDVQFNMVFALMDIVGHICLIRRISKHHGMLAVYTYFHNVIHTTEIKQESLFTGKLFLGNSEFISIHGCS